MDKTKITITLESREDDRKFDIELIAPVDVIAAKCGNGGGPSLEELIGDIFDADVYTSSAVRA